MTELPLAGVLGDPVSHSLSPRLHGHWLKALGIAGHYVPLRVTSNDLGGILRAMPRMGFVGANVTIPHKEAALELSDETTETARRIGAANTLRFDAKGRCLADNTDGLGFLEGLWEAVPGWDLAGRSVLVLGAGGAARAIIDALAMASVTEIRLVNRTFKRAQALAKSVDGPVRALPWERAAEALDGVDLVVNTTALGLGRGDVFPVSLDALAPGTIAYDVVYAKEQTAFLQAAEARQARLIDGLGMLIHQARPGFSRWFGTTPPVTADLRSVLTGP